MIFRFDMKPISQKTLRDATWKQVYRYVGINTGFIVFACDEIPGLTITHNRIGSKRTSTVYTFNKIKTESPSQAVRIFNAQFRQKPKPGEANNARPS